jgi:hypothetical protein
MADDSEETVNDHTCDERTGSCRERVQIFVDVLVTCGTQLTETHLMLPKTPPRRTRFRMQRDGDVGDDD